MKYIWCEDLKGYIKEHCCTSCHEDVDYGYGLSEIEVDPDILIDVCCAVSRELKEKTGL